MANCINVDIVPGPGVDLVADVTRLPHENGTVDGIVAHQIIEHLFPHQTQDLFHEWYRVLKPGGKLYVTTPDFRFVCEEYVAGRMGCNLARAYVNGTVPDLNSFDPDEPASYHRTVWDAGSLAYELGTAGFHEIDHFTAEWNLHCTAVK